MNFEPSRAVSVVGSIAVLAAFLIPRLHTTTPIETPKSKDSEVAVTSPVVGSIEMIEARLWEDPFEAIGRGVKAGRHGEVKDSKDFSGNTNTGSNVKSADSDNKPCHLDDRCVDTESVRREIVKTIENLSVSRHFRSRVECDFLKEQELRTLGKRVENPRCALDAPTPDVVKLILVPVHGGRSNDAVESRRRVRVALQTAMLSGDWTADNESHIGAMVWHSGQPAGASVFVPFEKFRHAAGAAAFVMWLDDDYFASVDEIETFVEKLSEGVTLRPDLPGPVVCDAGVTCKSGVEVSIVGPTGTPKLIEMLRRRPGVESNGNGAPAGFGSPFSMASTLPTAWARLYSPVSTVDEARMFASLDLEWRFGRKAAPGGQINRVRDCAPHPEQRLKCEFGERGLVFVRAVSTDAGVLRALITEIQNRRNAVRPQECAILIVSEGDSLYARSLADQIKLELERLKRNETDSCQLLEVPGRDAAGAYQYLQAINDSRASNDLRERESYKLPESAVDSGKQFLQGARDAASEGSQQFDYIRRLVGRIAEDSQERRLDNEHIFAVGVFGTNAHDKISILKLLRPALPSARFFTTDLDAILFDAEHRAWTRNLIVGSAYGLDAGGKTRGMPPFRSAQQSAYLNAFRAVIEGELAVELPDPQLYELGLRGPVRLSPTTSECNLDSMLQTRWMYLDWPRRVGSTLLGGFLVVLLWLGFKRLRRVLFDYVDLDASKRNGVDGLIEKAGVWARVFLCLLAAGLSAYWWILFAGAAMESCSGNGEPLALAEGVSLWMPTLLRGTAILLGVAALLYFLGQSRMAISRIGVERRLFLGHEMHSALPPNEKTGLQRASPDGRWSRLLRDYVFDPLGYQTAERRKSMERRKSAETRKALERRESTERRQSMERRRLWLFLSRRTCFIGISAVLVGIALFLLYQGLLVVMHDPNLPSRGEYMARLNKVSIWMAGIVMFSMAAAAWLTLRALDFVVRGMIRNTSSRDADSGAGTDGSERDFLHRRDTILATARKWGIELGEDNPNGQDLKRIDNVLFLELVNEFTKPAQLFVYAPVLVASVLILARWRLFENQTFPIALWMFFSAVIGLSLWNAWRLSRTACETRNRVLHEIDNELQKAANANALAVSRDGNLRIVILGALKRQVEDLRAGVYAPFLEQPFFKALLIPLGTGSILEWIAMAKGFG